MHDLLLRFVIHWPMEVFDVTPQGRVLNRFSKDVDTLDNVLPQLLRVFISQIFSVSFFYFEESVLKIIFFWQL